MFFPSSYKSLRAAIIYEGKSTIKVNEVKEHLLKKDKIDTQLTSESHHDNSGQVHCTREKSNNESSTGNSKHKNLTCKSCHKSGHIRAYFCPQKKKQPNANVIELIGEDEDKCDVLFVTDRSVSNKDRWIIDSGCSQYITSNRKMFSSYTSVQRKKSL